MPCCAGRRSLKRGWREYGSLHIEARGRCRIRHFENHRLVCALGGCMGIKSLRPVRYMEAVSGIFGVERAT